jgi:guanylate kinase
MQAQASIWRAKHHGRPDAGTLFLLDGASCRARARWSTADRRSHPSDRPDPALFTRERRPDDQPRREYLFVSREAFVDLARAGGFIEHRDFQFGMSYGLPWAEAFAPLLEGRHGLAVINLGNVRYVKALLPEAVTVLVDALSRPSASGSSRAGSIHRSRSRSVSPTRRVSRPTARTLTTWSGTTTAR